MLESHRLTVEVPTSHVPKDVGTSPYETLVAQIDTEIRDLDKILESTVVGELDLKEILRKIILLKKRLKKLEPHQTDEQRAEAIQTTEQLNRLVTLAEEFNRANEELIQAANESGFPPREKDRETLHRELDADVVELVAADLVEEFKKEITQLKRVRWSTGSDIFRRVAWTMEKNAKRADDMASENMDRVLELAKQDSEAEFMSLVVWRGRAGVQYGSVPQRRDMNAYKQLIRYAKAGDVAIDFTKLGFPEEEVISVGLYSDEVEGMIKERYMSAIIALCATERPQQYGGESQKLFIKYIRDMDVEVKHTDVGITRVDITVEFNKSIMKEQFQKLCKAFSWLARSTKAKVAGPLNIPGLQQADIHIDYKQNARRTRVSPGFQYYKERPIVQEKRR